MADILKKIYIIYTCPPHTNKPNTWITFTYMTAVIKFKAEKKRLQGITSSLKIGHNYKMNRETECFVVENDTLTVFTFTFANVFWQSTSVTKEGHIQSIITTEPIDTFQHTMSQLLSIMDHLPVCCWPQRTIVVVLKAWKQTIFPIDKLILSFFMVKLLNHKNGPIHNGTACGHLILEINNWLIWRERIINMNKQTNKQTNRQLNQQTWQ